MDGVQRQIDGRILRLMMGDITDVSADAIVNAANSRLVPGSGVDGAIHRVGGPSIAAEARDIGGCPTGEAVATGAGDLDARHVIHTVAPVWRGGSFGEGKLLASAYRRSLEVADALGDRTVAFPSLGTGVYGYPVDQAARIALGTVAGYLQGATNVESVQFVLFSSEDLAQYKSALDEIR